jgi:predicted transcriptional regulator
MGHYLAKKGAGKAVSLEKLSFQADPLISQIEENLDHLETVRSTITQLENHYNVHNLASHLMRLANL